MRLCVSIWNNHLLNATQRDPILGAPYSEPVHRQGAASQWVGVVASLGEDEDSASAYRCGHAELLSSLSIINRLHSAAVDTPAPTAIGTGPAV